MTRQLKYEIKKRNENDFMLKNHLRDFGNHNLLSQQKSIFKTTERENRLAKKISPFLIVSFCLPFYFTYLVIINESDKWFLLFLFVFVETNFLVLDFALCTYYEGRKKISLWIIETILIFAAGYFLFR